MKVGIMIKKVLPICLILVLLLACIAGLANAGVSYSVEYTDESGDVSPEENDDVDILKVSSKEDGSDIVITVEVAGDIDDDATYLVQCNVDGMIYTVSKAGAFVFGSNEDSDFFTPSADFEGSNLIFTVAKDDFDASSKFDIVYITSSDGDYNGDFLQGGPMPEGDDDDTTDDDDDWGDDDDWDDDYYDTEEDPGKETPTDPTIKVEITDTTYKYKVDEKEEEVDYDIEISVKGKTSGEVDHAAYTVITYYEDGTFDEPSWDIGDYDNSMSAFGMEVESYFKGTGPGGDTDWSTWEFKMKSKGTVEKEYWEDDMDDDDDNDTDEKKVKKVVIYVRAFNDEERENWGQGEKDVTQQYAKTNPDKYGYLIDDEESGLFAPGFEIILVLAGAILAVFLVRRYRD